MGMEVSSWSDENILVLNNGDGCITLNMLKSTGLYTFKG